MDKNIVRMTAMTARIVITGLIMLLTGGNARAEESTTSTGVRVGGSVFGGGNEAEVGGSVTVNMETGTVSGSVYGGGSLGKVDGNVTSTLTNCTVNGSVFGAGYSASLPPVEVMDIGFATLPYYYEDLGTYRKAVFPATTTYTWQQGDAISIDTTDHILYTTENLNKNNLGSVGGNVKLIIKGNTTVGENVFGGGESSYVTGADKTVTVTLQGEATVSGNVFGGGDNGVVEGSTVVNIGE